MCLKGLLNHVFQRLDFLTQRATFRIIFRKNSWHIFIENSVAFWHFLSKYFDTIHPPPNCIPAIESERRNQNDFLIKKLCISLQERKKLWYANKNKMNFHVKLQCLVLQLIFVPATNLKSCLLFKSNCFLVTKSHECFNAVVVAIMKCEWFYKNIKT